MWHRRVLASLSLLLVVALLAATPTVSAGEPGQKEGCTSPCAAAMHRHHSMQEKITAMDARLDQLVAAMNDASGEAKVEAMAAVVNELVSQRQELRTMAAENLEGDLHHLMWHVHDGRGGDCPMAMHHAAMHPEEPEGEDTAATH